MENYLLFYAFLIYAMFLAQHIYCVTREMIVILLNTVKASGKYGTALWTLDG
jgi:hypothetical protein